MSWLHRFLLHQCVKEGRGSLRNSKNVLQNHQHRVCKCSSCVYSEAGATEHLWLWVLSIGLHEEQWCSWMTTNTQLYHPLLLWNNVPTSIDCGISDGVQAVPELTSSRNNCTSTNHAGSLMSYSRTATCVLWQHKRSHISVHCLSGDGWKVFKLVMWG